MLPPWHLFFPTSESFEFEERADVGPTAGGAEQVTARQLSASDIPIHLQQPDGVEDNVDEDAGGEAANGAGSTKIDEGQGNEAADGTRNMDVDKGGS